VAVSTGLIGLFPRLHLAWVFTALSGLAALALVGLIAYAKQVEAEQQRRRARAERRSSDAAGVRDNVDPASAGHPGAWDDEVLEVQAAAR
jgi:hypothetical protein